jgi:hypothetical protein
MGRRPAAPLRCIGQPSDVEAGPCSPPRCSEIGRMTARRWQSVPPTREYETSCSTWRARGRGWLSRRRSGNAELPPKPMGKEGADRGSPEGHAASRLTAGASEFLKLSPTDSAIPAVSRHCLPPPSSSLLEQDGSLGVLHILIQADTGAALPQDARQRSLPLRQMPRGEPTTALVARHPAHRHSCDGQHIQFPAPHPTSAL